MKIYIATTPDRYELPIFVADSAPELARLCGCNVQRIYCGCYNQRMRANNKIRHTPKKGTKYKFFAVEVE